jgi:glycosyltransferase involved in cell wall biosynthesis
MKITIVLGAFFPVPPTMGGGVEKVWYSLAPEFVKRGHEVVMVSRRMPHQPCEEIVDGVRYLRVAGFNTPRSSVLLKLFDLFYSLRVKSILPPADILVTNTFWIPILVRDRRRGRVYVQVARYPKGQMRLYRNAARLQAPSQAVARAIAAEAPRLAEKIAVVPNPVSGPISTMPPPPVGAREKAILYVGRVHPEKGVHLLVEAFIRGTGAAFKDWRLMIVGPSETKFGGGGSGYFSKLQQSAAQAGERISFAGPLFDLATLEKTFRSARVFVYPSLAERGESFGLAPLEAMSQGCAALVSKLDCFSDFIRDGETGFVFDHRLENPVESLRKKMETLIADESRLSRVAESGRLKSAEYSPSRVADQFIADFSSLIPNADVPNRSR